MAGARSPPAASSAMETSQIQSRTWPECSQQPAQTALPISVKVSVPQGSGTLSYCRRLLRNKVTSVLYKQKSSPTACSWLSILRQRYKTTFEKNRQRLCVLLASLTLTCQHRARTHARPRSAQVLQASRIRLLDAGHRTQDAGCRMLDTFWLAGGSGSAAASHTCAQHQTGFGSSGETFRDQSLQETARYSSNLLGTITELWATFTQSLLLQAGTSQCFCYA